MTELAFVSALAFVSTFVLTFRLVAHELRMWLAANCAKVYATIWANEPVFASIPSLVEVPADLSFLRLAKGRVLVRILVRRLAFAETFGGPPCLRRLVSGGGTVVLRGVELAREVVEDRAVGCDFCERLPIGRVGEYVVLNLFLPEVLGGGVL
jgi:hypothetical protein